MSMLRIEDECIWLKHIVGNDDLNARLAELPDGEIVVLRIGNMSGAFRKMAQGKNPAPTPGLKPACDTTSMWWRGVYTSSKGQSLPIKEVIA